MSATTGVFKRSKKTMRNDIFPSILTDSLEIAQEQLDLVQGLVSGVQIDIIDGEFADNITFHPVDIASLTTHNMTIDIHLQTVEPIDYVVECERIQNLRTIIGQVERMSSQKDFIDHVASYGWSAGLSLDLYTPTTAIDEDQWKRLRAVQVMTIHAGFQGQKFEPIAVQKIREVRKYLNDRRLNCDLFVDGGITPETFRLCKDAGATHYTPGHYLWASQNIAESLKKLV